MDSVAKLQRIAQVSGLTQEAMAQRLGVSFVTLNAWINGRSKPRQKALQAINLLYVELVDGGMLDSEALDMLFQEAQSMHLSVNKLVKDRVLLDRLTLVLTYHTDAIEGSTMTEADTQVVLFEGTALSNRSFIEQLEAKNHQAALWWLLDRLQQPDFVLNEQLILDLHARLMNGILSDSGRYRRHAVRIANSRVTVANYLRVPDLVADLSADALRKRESIITYMARQHAAFERIHPFSDGNGRVGRLLLLAIAIKQGVVPPIIQRERRALYYKALEVAQLNEDFQLLQQLIAESIITASKEVFDGQ